MKHAMVIRVVSMIALWPLACSPTYAPPARAAHYGAPPRPRKGAYELSGTLLANGSPAGGGGGISYAVSDKLQVETGVDGYSRTFVLGHAGVRYAPLNGIGRGRPARLTFDLEGGLAIGVGGENCSRVNAGGEQLCDSLSWDERFAGGGYAGAGLGLNAAWFDLYLRGRAQLTAAQNAPETLWISGMVGAQATIFRFAKLYLAAGRYLYTNEWDSENGLIWEAGFSVFIAPN